MCVCVCECVCVCVWCVCVCVCDSTVNHNSSTASNGGNVVLHPNNISLKAHFLRYQPQIWNTTCLDSWL